MTRAYAVLWTMIHTGNGVMAGILLSSGHHYAALAYVPIVAVTARLMWFAFRPRPSVNPAEGAAA